jgi:hypothetical protein
MRAGLIAAALAAAGLTLAACGGASTPGSAPAQPGRAASLNAVQIAARLAPLGCAAQPDTTSVDIGIKPQRSLECSISGEDVSIDEYASGQQVASMMGMARGIGCSIAKQFGITDVAYVVAGTVTVSPQTAGTAQRIQDAIGAGTKLEKVHCG